MNTVIIGNGILALSIAFRLAKRSSATDRVTIIGKPSREGSATLAAAAMLNSFAEIEAGSLDSEPGLYRFELSHRAGRMWPKFEEDIIAVGGSRLPSRCARCEGIRGGCFGRGTYVINNTAADELDDANFDAILTALRDFNEPFALVSPGDIPNYRPEPRHRATRAVLIHDEGWINPRLMIEKLDTVLTLFPQVTFLAETADRLLGAQGRIDGVVLEDGRVVTGDRYILATGATTSDILRRSDLGIDVQRVFYGVGVSLEIKSPDHPHSNCIRTPHRGVASGLYTAAYYQGPAQANDHILVGATNVISPTPHAYGQVGSVESLMRAAIQQINTGFDRADLVRVNVGWRPTTQDTLPLLGRTSLGNLLIASGTKREGFHLAPLISETIVAMLFGEPVDERFSLFAPERKPHRLLGRREAIDRGVRQLMSAAYQHGFASPTSHLPERLASLYREDLERLHDQVGADDWGIPVEMADMHRLGHAA